MGYSQEDERMIGEQFDKLMRSCAKICKNEYDRDLIKRAFFLAKEAHEGVRRRSGEPYIVRWRWPGSSWMKSASASSR